MKIECKSTFLDGNQRFETGDVRNVEDELGNYFVAQGWAVVLGDDYVPKLDSISTDLDIKNVSLTNQMEVING